MGLVKKYSTIVAIGGDRLINKIASLIQEKEQVLGIIPLETSEAIHELIGTNDIKTACESLRFRKVKNINLAYIEPNKYFLTNISITSDKPLNCHIEIDTCEFKTTATEITLNPNLTLIIDDKSLDLGSLPRAWNWLIGKKTPESYLSVFKGRRIKVDTTQSLPVLVDGEIIAKTPIVARIKPKVLKIINSRDKMEEK